MKRLPGEDFEAYKERRKNQNKSDRILEKIKKLPTLVKKKVFQSLKTKISSPRPEINMNVKIGKKYLNEPLDEFRKRRKICNARRRQKEADQKLIINMSDPIWMLKNRHLVKKGYELLEREAT